MDTTFAKVLVACFLCQLIGFATCIPLKDTYDQDVAVENETSTGDNKPTNVTNLHKSHDTNGRRRAPIAATLKDNEHRNNTASYIMMIKSKREKQSNHPDRHKISKDLDSTDDVGRNYTSSKNNNTNKKLEDKPNKNLESGVIKDSNLSRKVNDKINKNVVSDNGGTKYQPSRKGKNANQKAENKASNDTDSGDLKRNKTSIKDDTKKKEDLPNADKLLIDDIFDDVRNNNSTEDETTTTGDYETTTTDEDIVRVPPEVLASLLGNG